MMATNAAQAKQDDWQGKPRRKKGWQLSVPPAATTALVPYVSETKHDKFIRLGVSRINRAMSSLRLIGNLANPSIYEWTEEDMAAMRITLSSVLEATLNKFGPKKPPAKSFKFEVNEALRQAL